MLRIINPYPGFENGFYRPYTESESSLFFGRAQDIASIKLKLRQKRIVTIVSDQKTGITSMFRAGVIPNLRTQQFDGLNGKQWKCLYFQPGKNPILSLSQAIVNPYNNLSDKIKPSMEEDVYTRLQKNDYGLVRVMEDIIGDQSFNILIIIDDLMEAFEKGVERKIRLKFLNLILKTLNDKTLPVYFLLSIKKTNYRRPELKENAKFFAALNLGLHKVKFLSKDGLQNAIELPAKFGKSEIDKDLSTELVIELLQDQDQLRKLQLLMSRTWMEWKRKHKDRYVGKEHYFKAIGQKSRAVTKGLQKSGKGVSGISIKDLENQSDQGNLNTVADFAKVDYENLNAEEKKLFSIMIPQLLDIADSKIVSRPMDLKLICNILGIELERLGEIAGKIPTIVAVDKRKISVNNVDVFNDWEEVQHWIRSERELRIKFGEIADAAILYYIDGIDIHSVISKDQYREIFEWYDPELLTSAWAQHQHENYELGLDFIAKLQEVYGKIVAKKKLKPKKSKMKIGGTNSNKKSKEKPDNNEDAAREEAMKILGMETDANTQEPEKGKKASKISFGNKPKKKLEIKKTESENKENFNPPEHELLEKRVEEKEEISLEEDINQENYEEVQQEELVEKPARKKKLVLKSRSSSTENLAKKNEIKEENMPKEKPSSRKKIVIKKK